MPATKSTSVAIVVFIICLLETSTISQANSLWKPESAQTTFAKEMARGDEYAESAAKLYSSSPGRAKTIAKYALRSYEKAIAAAPRQPEPYYRAAEIAYAYFLAPRTKYASNMSHKAVAYWHKFSQLSPLDPRATDLLFRRALVNTMMGTKAGYEAALRDYEALMTYSGHDSVGGAEFSLRLGNMAEIHMMLNQLGPAIRRYEQSLEHDKRISYGFGLAVALDRDGQVDKARYVMGKFVTANQLRSFQNDVRTGNSFFVPPGEVYYYYGLAYEVLGKPKQAIKNYSRYIQSGAHPQFQPRAQDNIRSLKQNATKTRRLRKRK